MAAQTLQELIDGLVKALVENSPFPDLAGEPMSGQMKKEMEEAMERLAEPIHEHVTSWAGGGAIDSLWQEDGLDKIKPRDNKLVDAQHLTNTVNGGLFHP